MRTTTTIYACDHCGEETSEPIELTYGGRVYHFDSLGHLKLWAQEEGEEQ